jgi:hypothetical protein
MKKIFLILMMPLWLSGCYLAFMDAPGARPEERWIQDGYSLDLVRDILYNHCGYQHVKDAYSDKSAYITESIKVDKCMLGLGFKYMYNNIQYNEVMDREHCELKDKITYDLPSCQSYRQEMSKWPKSWLRLLE